MDGWMDGTTRTMTKVQYNDHTLGSGSEVQYRPTSRLMDTSNWSR